MNWKRSFLSAAVATPVVALLAYGLTQDPTEIRSPLPGRASPDFLLEPLDGGPRVALSDLRGQLVVVNFWASWCPPCRQEHPELSRIAKEYYAKGVRFFGLLYQDSPNNARQWLDELGQNYPTLLDPGLRTAIDFGVYKVPETFFIDETGMLVEKKIGPVHIPAGYLTGVLDRMLANRQSSQ